MCRSTGILIAFIVLIMSWRFSSSYASPRRPVPDCVRDPFALKHCAGYPFSAGPGRRSRRLTDRRPDHSRSEPRLRISARISSRRSLRPIMDSEKKLA